MTNKDFLSQFTGDDNKPASFKEEERVKITKDKKPFNVKLIVIILAIVLAIVGLILFFVLRPTIEVKDFVGSNASEAKAWIKQNDIETQGIIFKEEYSFDYDEDYIISQSIEAGKKVRKNVKMDFIVSKGADPDELVSVPDIESMYKDEIQAWIKENKLTKTKVMSVYNDEVEDGAVVSYEFKGVDADSFTRSSILNITVSKGPQPAGTVTVEDFVKQDYSVVEAWGKKNKVEIYKSERYDDKIAKDLVISQSIEAKKTIKEGETLTVVVSKGKAVYAKSFAGMSYEDASKWASKNSVTMYAKYQYSNDIKDMVIAQSVEEGSIIADDITLTVSLGNPVLPKDVNSMTNDDLKQWINEVNQKGADISTGSKDWNNSDDVPTGYLISLGGYTSEVECGATLNRVISLGKNIWLQDDTEDSLLWANVASYDEDQIRTLCEYNKVNYVVVYTSDTAIDAHKVVSVLRNNNKDIVEANTYISESELITVTISTKQ